MVQCQFLNYLLDSHDFSSLITNNIGVEFFSDYKNEFSISTSNSLKRVI